jgi:type IV pilus assembly protein PilA
MKMNKKGFTLIELLIVVAIIAILAAIAIPQFSAYRIRGYNAAADSDLRNMKIGLEAFFTDYQAYASTVGIPSVVAPAVSVAAIGGVPGAGAPIFGPATYTITAAIGTIAAPNTPSVNANLIFGLSNNVGSAITTAPNGADYAVVTANTSGDSIYAGESGVTTILKAGKTIGGISCPINDPTQKPGFPLQAAAVPATATETPSVDLGVNFSAI